MTVTNLKWGRCPLRHTKPHCSIQPLWCIIEYEIRVSRILVKKCKDLRGAGETQRFYCSWTKLWRKLIRRNVSQSSAAGPLEHAHVWFITAFSLFCTRATFITEVISSYFLDFSLDGLKSQPRCTSHMGKNNQSIDQLYYSYRVFFFTFYEIPVMLCCV